MNTFNNMRKVTRARREDEVVQKRHFNDQSRRRLSTILRKKLQTTFIGALDKFEKEFGHIWGHGKPETSLTDREIRWREIWEETRTGVLNNGNNQLRSLLNELTEYDIHWNGKQAILEIVRDKEN